MNFFNLNKRIEQFDDVTRFRLKNMFFFCLGSFLLAPVLTDLKGEYLVAWVISMFMIGEQLMSKTNRYFVENYSISMLFKLGILIHVFTVIVALLYFINPLFMVLGDSLLMLIDLAIFTAYSIKLTNYLTENYPQDVSEFQIIRNSLWADGVLLALAITALITFFIDIKAGIICFIVYNIFFNIYLIKNWNFYSKYNL